MNQKQKKFILNKLIPFILREQGTGFVMDNWLATNLEVGMSWDADNLVRPVPVCGTVACIGGSAQVLLKINPNQYFSGKMALVAKGLGLNPEQAWGLFYGWSDESGFRWPASYRHRYENAKTPLAKAEVAASLLKAVVKTNGKVIITPNRLRLALSQSMNEGQ